MIRIIKKVKNLFLQGVAILLPFIVSIIILIWLVVSAEKYTGQFIKWVFRVMHISESYYLYGAGLAFTAVLFAVICIGVAILTKIFAIRSLFSLIDFIMERIPLVKIAYGGIKNIAERIDPDNKEKQLGRPARIYGNKAHTGPSIGGFVTHEDCEDIPGIRDSSVSMVYLQFCFNMGGFPPHFIPKERIVYIDDELPATEAFPLFFSAGLTAIKSPTKREEEVNHIGKEKL